MNDELKFWVVVILVMFIFIGAICGVIAWGNNFKCSQFIAENPDKDFRTVGIALVGEILSACMSARNQARQTSNVINAVCWLR